MESNNNKVQGNVFMLKQDKTNYVIHMYFVLNLFYKAAFTLIYFIVFLLVYVLILRLIIYRPLSLYINLYIKKQHILFNDSLYPNYTFQIKSSLI